MASPARPTMYTGPADRLPAPPYNPARQAPPVQYRTGLVTYDPS